MEKTRRCFKCGRSASEDPNINVFRFPKPGKTNSLRCELWAKYCFPDDNRSYSLEFQRKLYSEHRMLCSLHFVKTAFSDYPQSTLKLHRFAVPDNKQQIVPSASSAVPLRHTLETDQQRMKLVVPDNKQEIVPSASSAVPLRHKLETAQQRMELVVPDNKQEIVPSASSAVPLRHKLETAQQRMELVVPDNKQEIGAASVSENKKYRKCRQHMKTIFRLRKRVKMLKNKALLKELHDNDSVKAFMSKITPTFALLLQSQIKNFRKKSKGRTTFNLIQSI